MGWRTIVVTNNCKLSYKNNYLIIRNEDLKMIHLSEINMIIVENTMVSITSYLISELIHNKIKLIFCDEKHNPSSEIIAYYGAHNTSKKILIQSKWTEKDKAIVWQQIIKYKIHNQAMVLKKFKIEGYEKLLKYKEEVQLNDKTNREGFAAKVYFNLLFGKNFIRGNDDNINKALDYGYSILLSDFNKEIVSKGYITQLGINHKNEFNYFNLSCDLMEVFRPLIDIIVFENKDMIFDKIFKYKLINVNNMYINIDKREQFVSNAINIYVNSVLKSMENSEERTILNYEL